MKEAEIIQILEKVQDNYKNATSYKDKGSCESGVITNLGSHFFKTKFSSKFTQPNQFKAVWKSEKVFEYEQGKSSEPSYDNFELKVTGNTVLLVDKIKFKRELLEFNKPDFESKFMFPGKDSCFMQVVPRLFLKRAPIGLQPYISAKDCIVTFIDLNENFLDIELEGNQGKTQLTIDTENLKYVEVRSIARAEKMLAEFISQKHSQMLADIFSTVMKSTVGVTDASYYSKITYTEVDLKN